MALTDSAIRAQKPSDAAYKLAEPDCPLPAQIQTACFQRLSLQVP